MRAFYLLVLDAESSTPRRVEFQAEGPDHAFQVARNEADGVHVELWEGRTLLARMTKTFANVWKLLPSLAQPELHDDATFDPIPVRGDAMGLHLQ